MFPIRTYILWKSLVSRSPCQRAHSPVSAFMLASRLPCRSGFSMAVPSCPHQGPGCPHLHTVSAEPPASALQSSLLPPLSADSVPDPSPEGRRLTSTGIVCEPGQNRARDGNSTCQAPLSFPAANIPVSTQDAPGTAMETAQRGKKGEGWPTDGLISNPQPPLQPSKGTGAGNRFCDWASSSCSSLPSTTCSSWGDELTHKASKPWRDA